MAKSIGNDVLDAALAELATSVNQTVCSGEPANYAGIAAVTLAANTVTAGLGSGDWSAAADGDSSGRKTTMAQQTGVSITGSGTATHVAYDDGATLQGVTTCASQVLTAGGTVTIPAHKFEIADPT